MKLHFIFLVKEEDVHSRREEFDYVRRMSSFYGDWIRQKFGFRYEVECDMMVSGKRNILQRPDTHLLLSDHRQRGEATYHFYLTHFRPLWTDCTCEGYHAENFGMAWWQRPSAGSDVPFMAEKNCTTVSHELAHELLRQKGREKYIPDVHDVWTKHFYADLPFEGYDENHQRTDNSPVFLTMDMSDLT